MLYDVGWLIGRIRFSLSTTPSAEAASTPPIQEGSFSTLYKLSSPKGCANPHEQNEDTKDEPWEILT